VGSLAARYSVAVLDASAIVALLAGESAQIEVEEILADHDETNVIASLNVGEVVDVLVRTGSFEAREVNLKLDALVLSQTVSVIALDDATARRAGELRAINYHPRERNVSIADCVALAAAELADQALATCDPHQAAIAREMGIAVLPLPDRSGRRP
jgi:PIN domain nuclease of toxin-antitoxin system